MGHERTRGWGMRVLGRDERTRGRGSMRGLEGGAAQED